MRASNEDILHVLREYFKPRHSRTGREYLFSVHSGWSYEGIELYAWDSAHDWYIREHIPPEDVARAERDGFKHIGAHIQALEDRLFEHERVYLMGYH